MAVSFVVVGGLDRDGARRRELREVDLAGVLADADFEASILFGVSLEDAAPTGAVDFSDDASFSETDAGVGSDLAALSTGGSRIVAPTEETFFVPRAERVVSDVDSPASATGMPPAKGSKLPLKRI